jgi:acyl-CoA synthetase (AMP-forming)/AMP-acid ligase II
MIDSGERSGHEGLEQPGTLARLFLGTMRRHDRGAVLLHYDGERWRETPDWRLERQVIRLALLLRERARLAPGDRVAIVSRLRPESVVAELVAVAQGALAVAIDPDLPAGDLRAAIEQAAPAIALVSDAAQGELVSGARAVICFEGNAEGAWAWSEALELGGTLDTPERAQSFRAQAREVAADAPALGEVSGSNGLLRLQSFTHAEVVARMRTLRTESPARKGSIAAVAGSPTLAARLALLSFLLDGSTTCAVGMPGSAGAGLRPDWVVGPDGVPGPAQPVRPAPRRAGARALLDRLLAPFRSDTREAKPQT